MHDSHIWEDVSHHGSPDYQCKCCDVMHYQHGAKYQCPKRVEYDRKQAEKKEQEERYEYARMVAARERWDYLHAKYGAK